MQPARNRAAAQGYLTIRSIIQRSGVHRQTIHFYRRKGLLAPPLLTSRTSALYPPETVELIRLVRQYQDRRRLSLDEIAALFQRFKYDPQAIREDLDSSPALAGASPLSLDTVVGQLDPRPERGWVESLVRDGVLVAESRNGQAFFSPESVEVARSIWKWSRQGFPLQQFQEWARQTREQAHQDLSRFVEGLRANPVQGALPETSHLFEVYRQYTAYHRNAALRTRLLEEIEQALYLFLDPKLRQIFPSETFMARMGLNREIDRLRIRRARRPGDLAALRQLSRAYQLRSDWARLHEVTLEILRFEPGDALAAADLGRSLFFLGRLEEAHAVLENALRRSPHPLVKLRLGEVMILQARRSGDPARFLEALARKAELCSQAIAESLRQPALHRKLRLNLALDRMSTDDPLGLQGAPIEELKQLYSEFHALGDRGLSALSRISLAVARMFCSFALYLVLRDRGDRSAERYRREILRTDPDGILAAGGKVPGAGRKRSLI